MQKFYKVTTSLFLLLLVSCCTHNVTMVHTEGTAEDVVDDTATNEPNIAPQVTVPLTVPVAP